MCSSQSSRDAHSWNTRVRPDKYFSFVCDGWDNFFFLPQAPLSRFHFIRQHLLRAQTKDTKRQKMSQSKDADVWIVHRGCWQLSSAVWLAARCTFTCPCCWCFLSVRPSHLSLSSLFFFSLCVLVLSLCFLLFTHKSSSISIHPVILAITLDAIRPISPVSWCWVGTMRNGLVVMRVVCSAVRCVRVCVGSNECDKCVV